MPTRYDEFIKRIERYMIKAVRESEGVRTSWANSTRPYEGCASNTSFDRSWSVDPANQFLEAFLPFQDYGGQIWHV